ncbi:PAS domain S-box-containing protein [Paraburkholderia bannensis]|uniref:histidine kinase n=1 Tax=Paraburkholderia bannensis TaxID=765414 RepID=A0A7W9WQ34_9BURK|nr:MULTISPECIES: ATP-binding protein [Paraburkholderia]MBB3256686.1 PAS domain S-box-containing protein [Paraburkholderia sp. WP4_3_2]MBB6101685.1 PAS domain S-box-containing protein [Paraburkholderia bannensis]
MSGEEERDVGSAARQHAIRAVVDEAVAAVGQSVQQRAQEAQDAQDAHDAGAARSMADLVSAFDWSSTPLGAYDSWPNSLKSVVRLMLASRYAMWMAWGPDLTFLCNDAYRPTLGAKQQFLGLPSRDVWTEVWTEADPRIQHVLSTGAATWDENLLLFLERNGFKEETYHTFSYGPLHGDSGAVEGMLCVVTEDTRRILSDRWLASVARLSGAARSVQSVAAACDEIVAALDSNRHDLPFVSLYLLGADGASARKVASSHPDAARHASAIALHGSHADPLAAAFAEAARTGATLDAYSVEGVLPAASVWPEPTTRAAIVPLMRAGAAGTSGECIGFLVAGVSPRLVFDDDYRRFIDLVAAQASSIVEAARAAETERRRVEQLAALDRAKTTFFSNVSHELRTPLMLMLSPLDDLVAADRDPARLALLRLARRSGHRLLRLVNSLLDFARIEAGRIEACYEPTDLARLTQDVASTFRSAIERGGLTFYVQCRMDEPVYVDRQMWEKIVLNLLSNAFKFTLNGRIAVRLARHGAHAQLSVEDSGAGIPEQAMPRLFERFHRVEGTHGRTQEGSGIGLALVHELVKLHGGTIEAWSVPGQGSRFTVSLPLGSAHLDAAHLRQGVTRNGGMQVAAAFAAEAAGWLGTERTAQAQGQVQAQSQAQGQMLPAQKAASSEADGLRMEPAAGALAAGLRDRRFASTFGARVLLVDDNADMRAYVGTLLASAYQVDLAADGVQALDVARRERPDLIVSDVMMPRLDGFGLLAEVRGDPALRNVPVILLSARAGEEARLEGLDAGADDYLVKPFSARELAARVGALLERMQIRRANEQLLELALSSIQDQFFLLDQDARLTLVNPRFLELAGMTGAQALGRRFVDVCPQSAANGFAAALSEALAAREARQFETRCAATGRWFDTRIYPAAEGAAVLMTDVTERKQAQEAIRLRTAQFETLMNEAPLGVYLVDRDLRIREVNPAARPFFGDAPELIGEDVGVVMHRVWNAAYAQEIVDIFRRTLETGQPYHTPERIEARRDREASECYEWEVHRTPLPDDTLGLVCYFRDISAHVRVRQQLEEADHQKDAFLATLSHELRNPLAPIRSAAAILASASLTPGQLQWAADVIRRQVTHMSGLLDDLLDLARITCGKLELRRDVVSLAGVIQTAVEASRPLLERKHHALIVHAPLPDVLIDADALRLAQVVSNLLNNAGKYTDPGGHIELTVSVDGDTIELAVKDDGIGLPPDAHERLFAMFSQIDARSPRAEGGLGIGLALSKGLVRLHGGTIHARSAGVNLGSEFRVSLPIVVPTQRAPDSGNADAIAAPGARRVLVVDDNRDAAESLALLLSISGHEVRVAHAGEEALALAAVFRPQTVLLDLGMPGLSGYDVARALRAMPESSEMVVVALTGWGQDEDRRKTIAAGFDWHITKPADPEQIISLLTRSRRELLGERGEALAAARRGT